MSEDIAKKKEELLHLLGEVGPKSRKLEALGQKIVQSARFTTDVAGPLGELAAQTPEDRLPLGEWTRQVDAWRSWHDTADQLQTFQTTSNTLGAMSTAVANTSVSGVMLAFPSGPQQPTIEAPRARLYQTLDRYPLVEQATASMRRLGLDSRGGGSRTPVDLLQEAKGALDRPVVGDGGPVSVLVSLRECIDAAITELVRRRPKQETAKGWRGKIVSVGSQCAHPMLTADHFNRMGGDAEMLMNQLSEAKQTTMSRDQMTEFFNRGLLFLNALMDSIDESQLR